MDEITWTCHFCGATRPDSAIGVAATDREWEGVPVRYTRRFCRDRKDCQAAALAWTSSEHPEILPVTPTYHIFCYDTSQVMSSGRVCEVRDQREEPVYTPSRPFQHLKCRIWMWLH